MAAAGKHKKPHVVVKSLTGKVEKCGQRMTKHVERVDTLELSDKVLTTQLSASIASDLNEMERDVKCLKALLT